MRILITGRNDTIPADAMQRSAVPATQRVTRIITSPPARQPGYPSTPATLDAGDDGRAAYFLPPRLRGNSARLAGLAPSFDATACRWIVPPSSMSEDAGAAAELRHLDCTTQTRSNSEARPAVGPTSKDAAAGHLLAQAGEVLTVLGGVAVFGALALFFLVLA